MVKSSSGHQYFLFILFAFLAVTCKDRGSLESEANAQGKNFIDDLKADIKVGNIEYAHNSRDAKVKTLIFLPGDVGLKMIEAAIESSGLKKLSANAAEALVHADSDYQAYRYTADDGASAIVIYGNIAYENHVVIRKWVEAYQISGPGGTPMDQLIISAEIAPVFDDTPTSRLSLND